MFTGIIQEFGTVAAFSNARLTVSFGKNLPEIKIGDSIAINGVCLTVSKIKRNLLEFDVSSETIKKTTLKILKLNDKVNLEPALSLSGRLGGHMVSGHVDGVGEIRKKISVDNKGFELFLSLPSALLKYLVPKGSIAIDGVSLTVVDIIDDLVLIAVVPLTAQQTNLGLKKVGDLVNVEVDMLSKYVEKQLNKIQSGISEETLTRAGFMPLGWIEN